MSSGLRFTDRDLAQAWLDRTFLSWAAALSQPEVDAIRMYKLTGYEEINAGLRSATPLPAVIEDTIEHLDRALSRFRLPEPILTFRGVDHDDLTHVAVGYDIVDFAYTSTSLLRVVAEDFAGHASASTVAQIFIPGGTNVGTKVGAPDIIQPGGELEILLPRSTRFRVTGHTAHTVHLEVIT